MAEYQNIFTQVQVQGPPEMGMDPTGTLDRERTNSATFSSLAGLFGNAQLGPIHLGPFGLNLVCDHRHELLGASRLFTGIVYAGLVLAVAGTTG
jgi:hypothetical protein